MGKISLSEYSKEPLKTVQVSVEDNSAALNEVVQSIITPYCKDLDRYVNFISDCLKDGENTPTNDELDDFCLNLSTLIYVAGGMCEQLGIKDDIAKAIYKEVYHTTRSNISSGTISDKDSIAELESRAEQMTSICYTRAYKIMKSKVENAQELLGSCKKVLSRRMSEFELTHMQR